MAGKQLSIYLSEPEIRTLTNLAVKECRRPNDQARYILQQVLLEHYSENGKTAANITCEVHEAEQVCSGFAGIVNS